MTVENVSSTGVEQQIIYKEELFKHMNISRSI